VNGVHLMCFFCGSLCCEMCVPGVLVCGMIGCELCVPDELVCGM
jgi:hypothetical protein